ncbi:hypothetical protein DdX_19704 [Ditylenchus destructor]|uniref:Uncharacterized protein n=1 Tax=Ditylenchus destructor TaxID=166010 RepID=A0AAD4MJ87_9BILA|nr:hypothetical protein DdX_19704 [Ditylenchus destructor]
MNKCFAIVLITVTTMLAAASANSDTVCMEPRIKLREAVRDGKPLCELCKLYKENLKCLNYQPIFIKYFCDEIRNTSVLYSKCGRMPSEDPCHGYVTEDIFVSHVIVGQGGGAVQSALQPICLIFAVLNLMFCYVPIKKLSKKNAILFVHRNCVLK